MTDYGIALHRVIRGALLCLRIDRLRRPSESEVSHLGNPGLDSGGVRRGLEGFWRIMGYEHLRMQKAALDEPAQDRLLVQQAVAG